VLGPPSEARFAYIDLPHVLLRGAAWLPLAPARTVRRLRLAPRSSLCFLHTLVCPDTASPSPGRLTPD